MCPACLPFLRLLSLGRFAAELLGEVVGNGVEEGATDGDRAAERLRKAHVLTKRDGGADDDHGALRGVRNACRVPTA